MVDSTISPPSPTEAILRLRQQAEEVQRVRSQQQRETSAELSTRDMQALVHDLHVHQIELEMQNEELQRAQLELDDIRRHYYDLYDLAPIGYCTTNDVGMLLQINQKAADLLGIPQVSLARQPLIQFIAREDRDIFYLLDREPFEPHETKHRELRMLSKNGVRFWASLAVTQALDRDSDIKLHIMITDVSEQKQAQLALQAKNLELLHAKQELQKSNQTLVKVRKQLTAFIRHAPVSMAMLDMNLSYLACSNSWLKTFGREQQDLTGQHFYEIHPDISAEWKRLHRLGLDGAVLHNNEDKWERANGSVTWFRWSLQPWLDENGSIGGIIIVADDITNQKDQEAKIFEDEQRLHAIFDTAMDAILTTDEDHCITLFNPAAARMFGVPVDKALGQSVEMFIPARYRDMHRLQVENYGLTGTSARAMGNDGPVIGMRANGEEFPMEASISCIMNQNKKLFTVIIRDRTLKQKADDEIHKYQETLRGLLANQYKIKEEERIRIAREVHDELGSALTGVKANLLVTMREDELNGREVDQRLTNACFLIDSAVDTVRRVVTDLRPSVLDQLGIWSALEWLAEQLQVRSRIACSVQIGSEVQQIDLDPDRSIALFRIAQESLTNVVRHAKANKVEIRVHLADGEVIMEVEDNGIGIGVGDMDLSKRKSWGIAGMNERIRHFGGAITISDIRHGTLVRVTIPLEKAHD
ncbi:PAS domain S-box-containing protein [Oxalobacteraceae bacterium GrIS 1.18]